LKISPFANVIQFPTGVRTKRNDGDGGSARQQYDPNQTRQDQKDSQDNPQSKKPETPFDPKLIDDALQSFKTDAAAQEHGLSATAEGSGPGLKIHLKDCNGTVLRQFSGEEFLKLREATTPVAGLRGKLLDQKL
jgi:hypothetical protein